MARSASGRSQHGSILAPGRSWSWTTTAVAHVCPPDLAVMPERAADGVARTPARPPRLRLLGGDGGVARAFGVVSSSPLAQRRGPHSRGCTAHDSPAMTISGMCRRECSKSGAARALPSTTDGRRASTDRSSRGLEMRGCSGARDQYGPLVRAPGAPRSPGMKQQPPDAGFKLTASRSGRKPERTGRVAPVPNVPFF